MNTVWNRSSSVLDQIPLCYSETAQHSETIKITENNALGWIYLLKLICEWKKGLGVVCVWIPSSGIVLKTLLHSQSEKWIRGHWVTCCH